MSKWTRGDRQSHSGLFEVDEDLYRMMVVETRWVEIYTTAGIRAEQRVIFQRDSNEQNTGKSN